VLYVLSVNQAAGCPEDLKAPCDINRHGTRGHTFMAMPKAAGCRTRGQHPLWLHMHMEGRISFCPPLWLGRGSAIAGMLGKSACNWCEQQVLLFSTLARQ
jgi:hypothetical protein